MIFLANCSFEADSSKALFKFYFEQDAFYYYTISRFSQYIILFIRRILLTSAKYSLQKCPVWPGHLYYIRSNNFLLLQYDNEIIKCANYSLIYHRYPLDTYPLEHSNSFHLLLFTKSSNGFLVSGVRVHQLFLTEHLLYIHGKDLTYCRGRAATAFCNGVHGRRVPRRAKVYTVRRWPGRLGRPQLLHAAFAPFGNM